MKKLFLPLLAALGMTLGFTLTSCGGGGGSKDILVNLSGAEILISSPVFFDLKVGNRYAGNMFEAEYQYSGYSDSCYLTTSKYESGDQPVVTVQMSFAEEDALQNLKSWFGFTPYDGYIAVREPITLEFTFTDTDNGFVYFSGKIDRYSTSGQSALDGTMDLATGEYVDADAQDDEEDMDGEADDEGVVTPENTLKPATEFTHRGTSKIFTGAR